jgi:hypothetical protein
MKSKVLLRSLVAITSLLLQFSVWAQDVSPVTVHVKTAGTLPTLIQANRKDSITDLTLTGKLNGTDIRFIREMAGRNAKGEATGGKLAVLNLTGATIVQGGDMYFAEYADCYTVDNTISEWMFCRCVGLTSIRIPGSVTNIENEAFYGCTGLMDVTIPESVTNIGSAAFYGCNRLTGIVIPGKVADIGKMAFSACTALTDITISNPATNIGDGTFDNTAWFNSQPDSVVVYIGKIAYAYKGIMPELTVIQLKEGTEGIANSAFRLCLNLTEITIPESVKSIGNNAFYYTGLRQVTIPNSVTDIGGGAFSECYQLTDLTMGNRVVNIGKYAFRGCYQLTNIAISNSVKKIEKGAFYACSGLTSITIPNSVTDIGSSAFYACTGLTNITIPESVKRIESELFWGCTELKSVSLPESVTSIGSSAFFDCIALTSITIPAGVKNIENSAFPERLEKIGVSEQNPNYSSVDGILFNKDKTTLICYPQAKKASSYSIPSQVTNIAQSAFSNCAELTSITIPDNVTSLENEVFYYCTGLTGITIPNNVTSIGKSVFFSCTGLRSITIPNNVATIGDNAFYYCTGLKEIHVGSQVPKASASTFTHVSKTICKLYVPKGSLQAYRSAPAWSEFHNIIEESSATAIQSTGKDETVIRPASGGILIETQTPVPVSVYSVSGQKVYESLATGSKKIDLPNGLYIVKINNISKKTVVR